jgi:ATP-dependent DNA helicase RecQ
LERLEVAGGLAMFRISGKLPTLVDLLPKDASVRRTVLRMVEKAIGDRRDEAVYIHPRWLMQQLQMDRDTLNRHLRELSKLESFEYVPPFRGRAIHFRRRDVPFQDLKIDHETLAARKKADYEKLDRMVSYAQSRSCRQRTILEYFGDASASNCGICDRCQGKSGWPTMPEPVAIAHSPTVAIENSPSANAILADKPVASKPSKTKAKPEKQPLTFPSVASSEQTPAPAHGRPLENPSQGVSSGLIAPTRLPSENKPAFDLIITILKAVERTHGFLSKTLLSQHISGVESKAVQSLRLQRLPEFGILRGWKKSHASGFLDQTLDAGLLDLTELRAGKLTVSISTQGHACIEGSQPIPDQLMQFVHQSMLAAEKLSKQNAAAPPEPPLDIPVRPREPAAIRSLEKSSPERMAALPNATNEPTRLRIADDQPVRDPRDLPVASPSDASKGRDVSAPMIEDWRWTVRLVEHGYRLGECALVRGKTPDSILDDLTKAIQDGKRFSIESLFDRRTQIAIKELSESGSTPSTPPSIFQSYPSLWRFIQRWLDANGN